MADGAQIYRVELAKLVDLGRVDDLAGLLIAFAAEIVMLEIERQTELLRDRVENLESLADHFGTGAVAADHCNFVRHGTLLKFMRYYSTDGQKREGNDGRRTMRADLPFSPMRLTIELYISGWMNNETFRIT